MPTLVAEIRSLVAQLTPVDDLEARHRSECLDWLGSTDDVFRRAKPRTPSPHLVAYVLLHDDRDGSVLLVDHRKAGLWLPAGGHVEPGEHPVETVRRETTEELGITAEFHPRLGAQPIAVTIAETVGPVAERHTDVSLWFVLSGSRTQALTPDLSEFRQVRWWSRPEVGAPHGDRLEPHLRRVTGKLDTL